MSKLKTELQEIYNKYCITDASPETLWNLSRVIPQFTTYEPVDRSKGADRKMAIK